MIDVKETLNSAAERMEMAAMYLAEELSHIRAGRANVAILDGVRVNSYGSMVPSEPGGYRNHSRCPHHRHPPLGQEGHQGHREGYHGQWRGYHS